MNDLIGIAPLILLVAAGLAIMAIDAFTSERAELALVTAASLFVAALVAGGLLVGDDLAGCVARLGPDLAEQDRRDDDRCNEDESGDRSESAVLVGVRSRFEQRVVDGHGQSSRSIPHVSWIQSPPGSSLSVPSGWSSYSASI